MNITGNKKTDGYLKLGAIGLGIYLLFPYLKRLTTSLTPPQGGSEPLEPAPGCEPVNVFRETVIKNQMDAIYNQIGGDTWFLYPDEVNVILGYTNCELKAADLYFRKTYGIGLKQQIEGEWDFSGYYDAAEAKLKSAGL
jgi:hypothetical protein